MAYWAELTSGKRKGKELVWIFPSIKIYDEAKQKHSEVDVVSLSMLKDEKVEIALIECSESTSLKKATSDYRKILELL